jgi:hypothetical protein
VSNLTEAMKKTLTISDLHLLDDPRLMALAVVLRTFPSGFAERIAGLRRAAEADLAEAGKPSETPA